MHLNSFHDLDIILLCGSYGTGKTGFAIEHFRGKGRNRISRSEIRQSMYEMTNFGAQWSAEKFNESDDALVKHIERKILEHFLHNKKRILIINTFLTKKNRKRFIALAKQNRKSCGAIFLVRPLEECLERNKNNKIKVPDNLIRTLYNKTELPEKSEGFNEILIIDSF